MQMRRCDHAAVRVPGHGIFAIGGWNEAGSYEDVELLQLIGDDEDATLWWQMTPMLQPKKEPSACYFGGFVFVCSSDSSYLDLERFDVEAGATGQWTRITYQFSSDFRRNLLSLKGSLWVIGDLNAPSI